jgi:hypothetical protein
MIYQTNNELAAYLEMKIIFLDIDGVLNGSSEPIILPECARQFNRIVKETEARVVISSGGAGGITAQCKVTWFLTTMRTTFATRATRLSGRMARKDYRSRTQFVRLKS